MENIIRTMARRTHPGDRRLYLGAILVPPEVTPSEELYRARGRGSHAVRGGVDATGSKWVFRATLPESRAMIGEMILTILGDIRYAVWGEAPREHARSVEELAVLVPAQLTEYSHYFSATPIMPPLTPQEPSWKSEIKKVIE